MTDLSEFERKPRHRLTHPRGFEPGIQWDGRTGSITAELPDEPDQAVWDVLIAD